MKKPFSLVTSENAFKRQVDFSSVADGKNYPSDVDMRIEVNDRLFIEVEFKTRGKWMPMGQFRHFQNANELLQLGLQAKYAKKDPKGYGAYLIIATHGEDVDYIDPALTTVDTVIHDGERVKLDNEMTLPALLKRIAIRHDNAKLHRIADNALAALKESNE